MQLPKPEFLENDYIRDRAEEFRQKYCNPVNDIPVPIEEIVEIELRIEPVLKARLLTQYDIDAFLTRDFKQIYVDADVYMNEKLQNRLRFTYAHEVGHITLHKELIDNIEFESEEDWIRFRTRYSEDDLSRFEYQANEFAGRLLVPKDRLIEELVKNKENIDRFKAEFQDFHTEELIYALSRRICDTFKVSDQVIKKRIEKEGIWSELGF